MPKTKTNKLDGKESAEVEKKILELAEKYKNTAQIGEILKKKYGIPRSKLLGLKVTKILEKHNISYKQDYQNVEDKVKKIKEHIKKNKQDIKSKRELVRLLSHAKKLKKYKNKKNKIKN